MPRIPVDGAESCHFSECRAALCKLLWIDIARHRPGIVSSGPLACFPRPRPWDRPPPVPPREPVMMRGRFAPHACMSTDQNVESAASTDVLIERCLAGDQIAWNQIVRQHWRKVFNLAYKF